MQNTMEIIFSNNRLVIKTSNSSSAEIKEQLELQTVSINFKFVFVYVVFMFLYPVCLKMFAYMFVLHYFLGGSYWQNLYSVWW